MGIIINLDERRKKKEEPQVVKDMKASLDNEQVKRRYGIKTAPPPPPTFEERQKAVKESIARINLLMSELQDRTKKENT